MRRVPVQVRSTQDTGQAVANAFGKVSAAEVPEQEDEQRLAGPHQANLAGLAQPYPLAGTDREFRL